MLAEPPKKWVTPPPPSVKTVLAPPVNPELAKENERRAAEAKANEAARVARLTRDQRLQEETENRRLELTRKLTDRDGKMTTIERAAATDELRRLVSGQVTQQEREEMLDKLSTQEWRERFGVKNEVQPHLLERWDEDAEAEVLESFAFDGATPEQTRTVMSWYMQKFNQHAGEVSAVDWPAVEVEFRSVAKRAGLSQRLTDALIANERARIGKT
jgi:hypothetical protein